MFVRTQKKGSDTGLICQVTITVPVDITDRTIRVTALQAPPLTMISALPGAVVGWETGAGNTEQNFHLPRVGDMQALVSFFNSLRASDGSVILEAFYNESPRELSFEAYYNVDLETTLATKLGLPASITAGSFYINHVDPRNIYETVAYEIDAVGLHVVGAHTGDANTTVLGYVSRDGIIHTHNCHIIDNTQSFVVRVSEVKKSDLSSAVLPLPATEFFSVGLSIT